MNTTTTNPATMQAGDPVLVAVTVATTPADLFRRLVEPAEVEQWLGSLEGAVRPGHRATFDLDGEKAECDVLDLDPDHRLEMTWHVAGEGLTQVRFELEPDGAATRLQVSHGGLRREHQPQYAAGWAAHLEVLAGVVTGQPRRWDDAYAAAAARLTDGA